MLTSTEHQAISDNAMMVVGGEGGVAGWLIGASTGSAAAALFLIGLLVALSVHYYCVLARKKRGVIRQDNYGMELQELVD